jgi:SAM-dependent methyltransferase
MKNTKKIVSEHFSKNWRYWEVIYDRHPGNINPSYSLDIIKRKLAALRFIDAFAKNRSLKILDVGCGPGLFLKELLERGHCIVGIDMAGGMVHRAREIIKGYPSEQAQCIYGDIEDLQFADNSFDVVLCLGVLSYLPHDKKGLSEMRRVVKRDGIVVLGMPNLLRLNTLFDPYYYLFRGFNLLYNQKFLGKNKSGSNGKEELPLRKYVYSRLSALFRFCNLKKIGVDGCGYTILSFWGKEIIPFKLSFIISALIEKLSSRKIFSFMKIFANHWVITLQKVAK